MSGSEAATKAAAAAGDVEKPTKKKPAKGLPKNSRAKILGQDSRAGVERKAGWIEFPKSGTTNPKRYAMRRRWERKDGKWKKVSLGRALEFPTGLSEKDYHDYKERQARAKEAKKRSQS